MTSNFQPASINNKAKKEKRTCKKLLAKILGNTRLDEDALKTSFVFVFRRRLRDEYIHLTHTPSEDVLIKSNILVLVIHLQDAFKTSCQDVFKTSSRRFQDVPSS